MDSELAFAVVDEVLLALAEEKEAAEKQEPVAWDGLYREKCADGSKCLNSCHSNEPCQWQAAAIAALQPSEPAWPLIALGHGKVEVAEGSHEGKAALIFGRNGTGNVGEPTLPTRTATHEETLAVVTFTNVESLDVVLAKLSVLRDKLTPPSETAPVDVTLPEPMYYAGVKPVAYTKEQMISHREAYAKAVLAAQKGTR